MTLVPSDEEAILRALNLNPRDPKVIAMMLVAQKYDLDLILGHLCLVQGTVMIRKNGLLHVALRSGDHNGHKVDIEEKPDRFVATAYVYRKSMAEPISFTDECLKSEKVQSPRKRARTRALRNALAEAYDVAIPVYDEEYSRPETVTLSESRPPIPRVSPPGALPAGEGPSAPGLEAAGDRVPQPSPAGPTPNEQAARQSVVIRCREMGLNDDDRHDLLLYVTDGRTGSSKGISPKEAGEAHTVLHHLKATGEKLWLTSQSKKSEQPNQPLSENPAQTSTSSSELPSGDGADDAKPSSG